MRCPNQTLKPQHIIFSLFIAFVLAIGLGSASLTYAQEVDPDAITLVAIPPRLGDDASLRANPGETLQTTIRVRNASEKEVNVISMSQDFVVADDGSTPIPIAETAPTRWSLASWITLAPNSRTLAPGETQSISVVIDVPEDALPGGRYAMILHQPTAERIKEGDVQEFIQTQSGVVQRVGTLVYVQVNGPINEDAYIRDFNMPNFSEYGPVPFKFSVENLSDIHIKPTLRLEISNMFGQKVADIEVENKNVFPLTQRDFDGQFDQVWGSGKYFATLTMSYGETGKVAIAKIGFWLFPATLVLAVFILLMVVFAVAVVIRRHLISRKNDQSQHIKELESQLQELQKSQKQPLS